MFGRAGATFAAAGATLAAAGAPSPKMIWEAPPGAASTRLEGRSVRKLPTFCPSASAQHPASGCCTRTPSRIAVLRMLQQLRTRANTHKLGRRRLQVPGARWRQQCVLAAAVLTEQAI